MRRHASVTVLFLLFLNAPIFGWPTVYPTGTTLYDPATAFNGYTLFTSMNAASPKTPTIFYLINMRGEVVHQWKFPVSPISPIHAKLLPNGHLLVISYDPEPYPGRPGVGEYWMGGAGGQIAELDWEGKQVYAYKDLNMHHDFVKLPNGNVLYLAWEEVPAALKKRIRGGIVGSEHKGVTMFNDYLVEVNRQGKVVWTWHANDHLDPNIDIIGPLYKRQEWCHANTVALRKNGDIILTSRTLSSILIINKKSGEIVYRWGNPSYLDRKTGHIEYRSGPTTMGGPHDAEEIPDGYPGAGNLSCYDNRMNTGDFLYSRAVELDPDTSKVVWESQLTFPLGRKDFSDFMGGAQRLPNGVTLVSNGANGHLFQVAKDNKTVWEYVNPYMPSPLFNGAMFKARAYPPDYCPQFKSLASAGGAALIAPANTEFRVPEQGALPSIGLPVAAGLLIVTAAVAFFVGRKLAPR